MAKAAQNMQASHAKTRRAGIETAGFEASSNAASGALDWRKRMSDHVAYALLVYTGLTIFMTVKAMKGGEASTMPYFALVVLIAAIIPACRWFERRWTRLDDDVAHDPAQAGAFRIDAIMLWIMAIGLPVVLAVLFKGIFGS